MKRGRIREESPERSPVPLVVAIGGLLAAVASFYVRNEGVSATLLGSGLITAGWCMIYWVAYTPSGDE
jgi:hypothetical protein